MNNIEDFDFDPERWYEQVTPRPQLSDMQRNALRQCRDMVGFELVKMQAIENLSIISDPRARALIAVAIAGSDDYFLDGGENGFNDLLSRVAVAAIFLAALMEQKGHCGHEAKCRSCKLVTGRIVKLDATFNN